ncbi:mechanosensitive ion channel family protein [Thermodesulfobacteriota bacterium]
MDELPKLFREFFGFINVKSIEALGIKVLAAATIFMAAFWISRTLQRFIDHRLGQDGHSDEATIRTYKNIIRLIVMVPGVLIAVYALGLNLSALFTTGGLFAVAMAFAMKEIAENYVSGLMLRLERTIKPGDVLETEGAMVKVKSIGFRATSVRSKDEKDLVIPNSQLVQKPVVNYTYRDSIYRLDTTVGVAYSSDLKQVQEVLQGVCNQLDWISSQHKPQVLLSEFGDSAVNFNIRIWIADPWKSERLHAGLNNAVWWGLKDAGIVIAFPQIDVHFNGPVTKTASIESQLRAGPDEEAH